MSDLGVGVPSRGGESESDYVDIVSVYAEFRHHMDKVGIRAA